MKPETIDTTAVTVRDEQPLVRAEDFMPLMTVEQAVGRKKQINAFIAGVMVEGEDYGKMPGGQQKKVLLKPGAEKLCSIFGLVPQYIKETIIEDWTGAEHAGEPLFYYEYRCQLSKGGRFMGEAIGSANSWEQKHRYRWVTLAQVEAAGMNPDELPQRGGTKTIFEPIFALDKAETTGKYGKPAEYWENFRAAAQDGRATRTTKKLGTREFDGYAMTVDETQYRIPNPDSADLVNTLQKMAQKRALVAAVLVVTNCSDAFTQDLEDFSDDPAAASYATEQPQAQQAQPGEREVPEELQILVRDIHAGKKGTITAALSMFESQFARKCGGPGVRQFQAMQAAYRDAVPKEKETKQTLVNFFLDAWDALGQLPAAEVQGGNAS